MDFRRTQITTVVAAVAEQARKIRPGIKISAAVFRNWPTDRDSIGQDWKIWCDRGYLDFVCPMDYIPDTAQFMDRVTHQVNWVDGRVPLYIGIGAWQIPSSQVYLLGPLRSLNATVLASAQEVFDSLVYLPGEEMTVVAGSAGDYMSNDAEELLARARRRGLESDMLYAWLPDMLRPIFTDYVREQIEAAEHVSINTDQRPLAYFYHQAWWLEHRHPGWGERLSTLAQRPAWQWFAAVAGLLLLWAVISLTGLGQRAVIPAAVAVAGLCGMTGEMVLLLNFQSYYGYVFQQIGFIVGSFMVGLAAGSWLLGRWLRPDRTTQAVAHCHAQFDPRCGHKHG